MIWSKWIAGSDIYALPVYINVTHFQCHSILALPGIYRDGKALGKLWPSFTGTVGTWLWMDVTRFRAGSASVWRSESDMRDFVRTKAHQDIVARHRSAGKMTSVGWCQTDWDKKSLRASAEDHIRLLAVHAAKPHKS